MPKTDEADFAHPLANPAHFSEGFHAAFRTGMDGPLSAHIHNLIHALPGRTYGRFVTHVTAGIADGEGTFDARMLRDACLSWGPKQSERAMGDLLKGALRLLTSNDWVSIAGFLTYDPAIPFRFPEEEPDPALPPTRDRAHWASLNRNLASIKLVADVVDASDAGHVIGSIEPVMGPGAERPDGYRRREIVGWRPRLHGGPRIKAPTANGFATAEEAFEACRAALPTMAREANLHRASRLRSGDPDWAALHGPGIERACRHIASITDPGVMEGSRVLRMLWGPEYALQAYRISRNRATQGPAYQSAFDRRPLAERLELFLRGLILDVAADRPEGFLARLAIQGEASAVRQFREASGDQPFFRWCFRTPEEAARAFASPEGLPDGSYPIPAPGEYPFSPPSTGPDAGASALPAATP